MRLSQELRSRTKALAVSAISAYVALPRSREDVVICGRQFLRAATSLGAHAREASRARSDAEFCSKIDILLQEADESQYWAELLQEGCHLASAKLAECHGELDELVAIFTTISANTKRGKDRE